MKPKFPRWLGYEGMVPKGTRVDADGQHYAEFDLIVRPRWYRFFFPSYWRSNRWRFR